MPSRPFPRKPNGTPWPKGVSGNPAGRRPGIKDARTLEVQEVARRVILGDLPDQAIAAMAKRVRAGTAPHLEQYFVYRLWGKPHETVEINLTQKLLVSALSLSDMELQAFVDLLERNEPQEALKLLPEDGT
jgi:hypothetical protein